MDVLLAVATLDVSIMFEDAWGCRGGANYEQVRGILFVWLLLPTTLQGLSLAIINYIGQSCNCSTYSINGGSLQCSNVSQFHGVYQFTIVDVADSAKRVATVLSQLANISANIVLLGYCSEDGDVAPTTTETSNTSNTLLIVLLVTCTTLLLLTLAITSVTMYR